MGPSLSIGETMPPLDLIDHDGQPWNFADHRGQPIVVILHRHLA